MGKSSVVVGRSGALAGSSCAAVTAVTAVTAVVASMAIATPAHAEAGVAASAPAPERHVALSVGLSGSHVRLANSEMPETMNGTGKGVVVDAAYYPVRQIAIVAEAWWTWNSFGECIADASCFSYLAEEQTLLTGGLRLPLSQSLSLQATAGAARSDTRYSGVLWAPVIIGAAAWRFPAGPVELGVELRASTLEERGTQVTNVGLRMMMGKSW